jgi:RNA polymerase sigma-70 factor (ECF subfamily)
MLDLDQHLDGLVARNPHAMMHWIAGADPVLRRKLRPLAARLDAESVLQETYLRVWHSASHCTRDDRPNALLRYAARVLRNLVIDELRRTRLQPTEEVALESYLAEQMLEPEPPDPLLRRVINRCRKRLPPQPSAALQARLDATYEPDARLAERVNMRLNTFLQNIKRARELLAECLQRNGVTDHLRPAERRR